MRAHSLVGGRARELRSASSLLACATSFGSMSTPVTEAAWKLRARELSISDPTRYGRFEGGGVILSRTELARYASRVAADVETGLGGKKPGDHGREEVQARINNVNR
jgi:hypothetical protein